MLKILKTHFCFKICLYVMVSFNCDAFCHKLFLHKEIWQKIFEGPGLGVGPALGTHTIQQKFTWICAVHISITIYGNLDFIIENNYWQGLMEQMT